VKSILHFLIENDRVPERVEVGVGQQFDQENLKVGKANNRAYLAAIAM
jgi:hypothetical protein